MNAIEPGTPVIVTVRGTAQYPGNWHGRITTPAGMTVRIMEGDDPDVSIVPVDPERPTLDLLSIARIVADTVPDDDDAVDEWLFLPAESRNRAKATAQLIIDLVEAAHPGLIR